MKIDNKKEEKLELLLRYFRSDMREVEEDIDKDTYGGEDFDYSDQHSDWINDCYKKYVKKIRLLFEET